jgi:hypothetical protein
MKPKAPVAKQMNKDSIDCRWVISGQIEKPGDFKYSEGCDCIYIWMPGMSGPDAIEIQHGNQGGLRVWGWDGNIEKPTLTPSLHVPGVWHGYLKKGRLESC